MSENVLFKRRNFNSERILVKGLGVGGTSIRRRIAGSQAGPGSHSLCFQLTLGVSEHGGRVGGFWQII